MNFLWDRLSLFHMLLFQNLFPSVTVGPSGFESHRSPFTTPKTYTVLGPFIYFLWCHGHQGTWCIVCSRFLFVCLSFCRSILPFHFLINLSHVGAPVWPSPVTSSFTNADCFPQVCGLIIHLPAVDVLQPPGPVTSLFCWTFLSSQTLHSSHSRHLVHILLI